MITYNIFRNVILTMFVMFAFFIKSVFFFVFVFLEDNFRGFINGRKCYSIN